LGDWSRRQQADKGMEVKSMGEDGKFDIDYSIDDIRVYFQNKENDREVSFSLDSLQTPNYFSPKLI
jgi:hypothetical protein